MRLGERLRRRRKDLGLKQGDVAKQIGVSQETVSKWENGQVPDRHLFQSIAGFLGVTEYDVAHYVFSPDEDAGLAERISQLEAQMALVLGRLDQLADRWPGDPPSGRAQP